MNTKISHKFPYLQTESINVIASMLKVLPTGVFQKTLADGLAYAVNLSNVAFPTITIKESNPG